MIRAPRDRPAHDNGQQNVRTQEDAHYQQSGGGIAHSGLAGYVPKLFVIYDTLIEVRLELFVGWDDGLQLHFVILFGIALRQQVVCTLIEWKIDFTALFHQVKNPLVFSIDNKRFIGFEVILDRLSPLGCFTLELGDGFRVLHALHQFQVDHAIANQRRCV